jgi:membrane dipeptidase
VADVVAPQVIAIEFAQVEVPHEDVEDKFDDPNLPGDIQVTAPSQNISSATALPPALELMPAQRAVFAMVSLLLRIERESQGRVRVCRNVDDIQQAMEDGLLAPVMHIEGAEAIDPNFEVLDVAVR